MKTLINTFNRTKRLTLLIAFLLPFILTKASLFNFSEKLDSIQLIYNENQLRIPGEYFEIGVVAYLKNGKMKKTTNLNNGYMFWSRFTVEVKGGKNNGGRIYVNEHLKPSKGKYILVKVYPNKAPELSKELLLPLNYETNLQIEPISAIVKAPGFSFKFKLKTTFDNGIVREYGYKQIKKYNANIKFIANGGIVKRNKFLIDPDFRNIQNHRVNLTAISMINEKCIADYDILLDYKATYYLNLSGSSGFNGSSGSDGSDGSSGSNGSNGSHGQNGWDGGNGHDVGLWSDVYYDSILGTKLMYVYVEDFWSGAEYYYLLNPDGGAFFVSTEGGTGGNGGNGGDGGDGGKGDDGCWYSKVVADTDSTTKVISWQGKGEDGGNGGNGGYGGDGGYGGNGGDVFLYFTEDASIYSEIIIPDTDGGWGGNGGSSGSGGSGGNGGSGSPNGSGGSNGSSGSSGRSGWYGSSGSIYYDKVDDFIDVPSFTLN